MKEDRVWGTDLSLLLYLGEGEDVSNGFLFDLVLLNLASKSGRDYIYFGNDNFFFFFYVCSDFVYAND